MALCAELRRLGMATPVLILTARGRVEDRVSGLDAGADDYLAKPFSREEFLAPFWEAKADAHHQVQQVRELTVDKPDKQQLLDVIENYILNKVIE